MCIVSGCGRPLDNLRKEDWCRRHTKDEIKAAKALRRGKQSTSMQQTLPSHGVVEAPLFSGAHSLIDKEVRVVDVEEIAKIVLLVQYHFNLPEPIGTRTRREEFLEARKVLMYLLYKDTPLTMANVGVMAGNIEPPTVSVTVRKMHTRFQNDTTFRATVALLRSQYPTPRV